MAESLESLARRYLAERLVSDIYAQNLLRVAQRCRDLTADAVNCYLRRRLGEVAAVTAKGERTMILSVWRYAYEQEIVDSPARGIVKIKPTKPPTQAWTIEQLKAVLAAAGGVAGAMRTGVQKSLVLRAWILLGYESGSRYGDIWAWTRRNIDGDVLRWTQHKTGDGIQKVLSPACLSVVNQLLDKSPDGRVIGWVCGRRQAMRMMKGHLTSCGLPGTSKWLRRSGATHIEMETPGRAKLHLGHRSVGLAERAYLDWGQIRTLSPQTPRLTD